MYMTVLFFSPRTRTHAQLVRGRVGGVQRLVRRRPADAHRLLSARRRRRHARHRRLAAVRRRR